ncbi:MAG: hypothetical protein U5R30_10135 [Deltaproteobacteria bacterium]|nr:hypothetical protein [Deltaproteobacteria bacterium]
MACVLLCQAERALSASGGIGGQITEKAPGPWAADAVTRDDGTESDLSGIIA